VWNMTYRTRIKYTAEQKAEMWDRWQRGESAFSHVIKFGALNLSCKTRWQ